MERVFLITGSNRGERLQLLQKAASGISSNIGKIVRSSSVYETEPWGFIDPVPFLNQVHELSTGLKPPELLESLHRIEDELGRSRTIYGYGPRTMDIDILFYGQQVIDFPGLRIPHPLLQERKFVLVPLAEIAGDLVHPVLRVTISELLAVCGDQSSVVKMP